MFVYVHVYVHVCCVHMHVCCLHMHVCCVHMHVCCVHMCVYTYVNAHVYACLHACVCIPQLLFRLSAKLQGLAEQYEEREKVCCNIYCVRVKHLRNL